VPALVQPCHRSTFHRGGSRCPRSGAPFGHRSRRRDHKPMRLSETRTCFRGGWDSTGTCHSADSGRQAKHRPRGPRPRRARVVDDHLEGDADVVRTGRACFSGHVREERHPPRLRWATNARRKDPIGPLTFANPVTPTMPVEFGIVQLSEESRSPEPPTLAQPSGTFGPRMPLRRISWRFRRGCRQRKLSPRDVLSIQAKC